MASDDALSGSTERLQRRRSAIASPRSCRVSSSEAGRAPGLGDRARRRRSRQRRLRPLEEPRDRRSRDGQLRAQPARHDQRGRAAAAGRSTSTPTNAVDGILVQLPLPSQIDATRVIETIDPGKDVDGFHPVNAGRLAAGLRGARAVHAARLPLSAQAGARRSRPASTRWSSAAPTSSASRWPSSCSARAAP